MPYPAVQPSVNRHIAPLLDDHDRVAVNLPCIHCRYNLRTLASEGRCPECGHPVMESLRARYLWQSPPSWVENITTAARALTICVGLVLGLIISIAFVGLIHPPFAESGTACAAVLLVFLPLVVIAGLVGLTERDPNLRHMPEGFNARRVIRWSLQLIPVVIVAFVLALAVRRLSWLQLPCVCVALSALILLLAVPPLALCRHLATLMRRIPSPRLVRFARVEFWAVAFAEALLVAGNVLDWFRVGPFIPIWRTKIVWLVCALSMLSVTVAGFVLLILVTRALGQAHRRAKRYSPRTTPPV